jgi:hypothetical protein
MHLKWPSIVLLVCAEAFAQPAAAIGPPAPELARALAGVEKHGEPSAVRKVVCRDFPEEPTEYRCTFERQARGGRWEIWGATVTFDRAWVILDLTGPCRSRESTEQSACEAPVQ